MYDAPEGFEVPLFQGPLKPRLSLGAPRDWTFAMAALGALGLLYKLWALVPLVVLLQVGAIWGTRQDDKWFQKIPRVMRYKRYYKP
jgi:type IV secretory pathway TrbD component